MTTMWEYFWAARNPALLMFHTTAHSGAKDKAEPLSFAKLYEMDGQLGPRLRTCEEQDQA